MWSIVPPPGAPIDHTKLVQGRFAVEADREWDEHGEEHDDHASAACVGCCIGQVSIVPDGFGLPKSTRTDAVTALTGFQLASVSSHFGMPCVGTNAFDTKESGNSTMKATPCAASGFSRADAEACAGPAQRVREQQHDADAGKHGQHVVVGPPADDEAGDHDECCREGGRQQVGDGSADEHRRPRTWGGCGTGRSRRC